MRLDYVKHRRLNNSLIQAIVNQECAKGKTKEEIYDAIEKRKMLYKEVDDEEYTELNVRYYLVESNIGKGYLVYLLCPNCNAKVRYVYIISRTCMCRKCHGLTYKKADRRECEIRRLMKDPELRARYMETGYWRNIMKALEAEWRNEN